MSHHSKKVKGVSPEQPLATNEHGGKQSDTPYAFHLLDPKAMFTLAERTAYGATRYDRDNWKKITKEEHLNHALQHIYADLAEDEQDDHLGAAICRLMFAIGTPLQEREE